MAEKRKKVGWVVGATILVVVLLVIVVCYFWFLLKPRKAAAPAMTSAKMPVAEKMMPTARPEEVAPMVVGPAVTRAAAPSYVGSRKVIMTADLRLGVKGFDEKYNQIVMAAEAVGGFVANSMVSVDPKGYKSGTLVIRVPQRYFYNTLSKIEELGKVRSKKIQGEEVTEEFVDLQSRIRNLQAEKARLLDIYRQAYKIADILSVESEVTRVQGEIEQAQGRLNYLAERVEFSTITLNIYEKPPKPAVPLIPKFKTTLLDVIKGATRALLATLRVLATIAIWLGIFGVIWVPILALIWYARRKIAQGGG